MTIMLGTTLVITLVTVVDVISAACPDGYTARTNGCYKVYTVTSDTSRDDAQRKCRGDNVNSSLVSIRSIEDNDFYSRQFPDNTRIWLGLSRDQPKHPIWINIADDQPILNQGCYKYDSNNTDFKEMAPQSPPGGVTYQSCIDYCQSKAGSNYAYAAVTGTSGNFQCGCAAEDFTKDKQFDPGTNPKDVGCTELCDGDTNRCGNVGFMVVLKIGGSGFDQWAYGQTNNFDGYQTCGALITQHNPDKLGDEAYSSRFPFICQDKGHNFHVYEDYVSWFEARNRCRNTYNGGDLAKLRNNTDRDNLTQLGAKAYWTGLINTLWRWPNGDALVWSSWEPGQPNWKPNTCVSMDTSTKSWKDESCTTGLRNFICETYTPPTTTTTTTTAATTGSTATPGNKTTPPTGNATTTANGTVDIAATTQAYNATNTRPNVTAATTYGADKASGTATNASTTTTTTRRPIYTTTRTRISGETTVATAGNDTGPGSAGASTDNGSGLSILEIVLIVMCILLLILIIVLIILVFYFKKRNNRRNKIGYDIRAEASVPNNEAMREEVYLPSEEVDDKSLGSQTDLIKQNGLISNRRPLPNIKINGDVR